MLKHRPIERTLAGLLLVIAGGIVVHAPLTVWLGVQFPHYSLLIKSWKEILMGIALVLLIIEAVRAGMVKNLLRDRVIQLSLAFAVLHFIMIAVFRNGLQEVQAGLLIDLRFVLYFVLMYGTIKLFPRYRKLFVTVFSAGAAIVIIFGLLQMFVLPRDFLSVIGYGDATIAPYITVDQNPAFIRISSTLRGPNPLGAYVVIILSFVVAFAIKRGKKLTVRERWLLGAAAVASGIIMGSTYSRSSLIGLFVALFIVAVSVTTKKIRKNLILITAAGVIVVGTVLIVGKSNPYISNVVFHDSPTTGAAIDSNEGHAESLSEGVKRFVRQPFGEGVGSTGSASLTSDKPLIIENQYLFVAHEVGWLGLGIFTWLFIEVLRRLWQRRTGTLALGVFASGCGLAVIGLLLPVWVDDTVSIIWWGLAALALGGAHYARKSH